jgi:hypothetical protein
MWLAFQRACNAFGERNPEAFDPAIASAQATFDTLYRWLE